MPGYSGTPLPKKLGIRSGFRVYLVRVPAEVRTQLSGPLTDCRVVRFARGPLDFVMLFPKSRDGFPEEVERVARSLAPAGMLWVCWLRKSARVVTDLNEHAVRETGLRSGLVDVKVCALTDTWSGLKFVRRVGDRRFPTAT